MKRDMALIVGIGTPQKRSGPPPMPKRKTQEAQPAQYAAPEQPEPEPHEMAETPTTERAEHSGARVTPEAVCYRGADEVCSACEYFVEGHCELLDMPVEEAGGCNAFAAKTGAMEAIHNQLPSPDGEETEGD